MSPRRWRVRVATAAACGAVLAFMTIQAAGDISWPSSDVIDAPQPQRVNVSGPEIENEPFEPPSDVIPSLVAAEPVICRSDEAVVQMRNVRAYDGGWTFDLVAMTRRDQTGVFDDQDVGFGGDNDSRSLADNILRFRLVYPDGREVDNVEGRYAHKNLGPGEGISLDWSDAGGDDGTYVWAYSVKPLPPQGTIQIDCEWPSLGAREERTSLSASALRSASKHAVQLWRR